MKVPRTEPMNKLRSANAAWKKTLRIKRQDQNSWKLVSEPMKTVFARLADTVNLARARAWAAAGEIGADKAAAAMQAEDATIEAFGSMTAIKPIDAEAPAPPAAPHAAPPAAPPAAPIEAIEASEAPCEPYVAPYAYCYELYGDPLAGADLSELPYGGRAWGT